MAKYKYYWEDDPNQIIELEGFYNHGDDAARQAAHEDYHDRGGFEREDDYPVLVLVNEDGEEEKYSISIEYDPVFFVNKV